MSLDQPIRVMHRIATVRKRQGQTLRAMARRMGVKESELRREEDESADLFLSRLYAWQKALDVPLSDLLVEPDPGLCPNVQLRAQLLELMKTAASLRKQAEEESVDRLVQSLFDQIVELVPEFKDIGPWPSTGSRRSATDFGRVVERQFPDDWDHDG